MQIYAINLIPLSPEFQSEVNRPSIVNPVLATSSIINQIQNLVKHNQETLFQIANNSPPCYTRIQRLVYWYIGKNNILTDFYLYKPMVFHKQLHVLIFLYLLILR